MSGISVTELIEMIIDHLRDDKLTLASCAAVSKTWLPRSRYHLFHTIKIIVRTPDGPEGLSNAAAFFSTTPSVCGYVRHVQIRATDNMDELLAADPGFELPAHIFSLRRRRQAPHEGVDLRQISTLAHSIPNPFSMDLDGVYPIYPVHDIPAHVEELKAPPLQKLILRGARVPSLSLESCFCNLAQLFPNLVELSLINLEFEWSHSGTLPWGGDFPARKLLIHNVTGLLGILPCKTAFHNVTHLNIPLLFIASHYATLFWNPLIALLEHLTLSIAHFGVGTFQPAFQLSACSRLRSIQFLQTHLTTRGIPSPAVEAASGFRDEINSLLQLAPLSLRRVTITLLKYEEAIMQGVIDQWDWDETQRILRRFQQLESVKIAVIRETTPLSREGDLVEPESMTPQLQSYVCDEFEWDFLEKLRFE